MFQFHVFFDFGEWPNVVSAICAVFALIITALGTYYVVKSFRHQVTVNQNQADLNAKQALILAQQLKMNELEIAKNKRSIRPIFDYIPEFENNGYVFILRIAIAKEICVSMRNINSDEVGKLKTQRAIGLPDVFKLLYEHEEMDLLHKTGYYLQIDFQDEDGTPYFQTIRNSDKIRVSFPKIPE